MDKQRIVDEIRRTAAMNGGKPFGVDRFYKATGIKRSDWLGKIWARWGDALLESGFEPNQLMVADEESNLLEKFIGLMREMSKFPTMDEVKMKARSVSGFPWHSSFRRFGSKQQFAARILEYSSDREGYDDVVALCKPIAEAKIASPSIEAAGREETFGFVYLMKSGKYYKIGRSYHVGGRERDLSIQLPEMIRTVHFIKTDDPNGIEAYWHKRFESKRKNGEWFDLTAADITAFKRRKFM